MDGEGRTQDYKLSFDPNDNKAKVDLVKNLVALANAGGGQIVFGCSETARPGIDDATCQALDSARLADFVVRYIKPAQIDLSHKITALENGCRVLTVSVGACEYPIVMSRTGDWKGKPPKKSPLFRDGDVWVRHSSKTTWTTSLHRASAYDSFYLALADAYDAPLWTADGKWVRAVNLDWVRLGTESRKLINLAGK